MGELLAPDFWRGRLEGERGSMRVVSPATKFVHAMKGNRTERDRLILAHRALRQDDNCIEANMFIAAYSENPTQKLAYLHVAVEAGEELWGWAERSLPSGGLLDSEPASFPWLSAMCALAVALEEAGETDDAAECMDRLSRLDPSGTVASQYGLSQQSGPISFG
jgi:hypothetical protein